MDLILEDSINTLSDTALFAQLEYRLVVGNQYLASWSETVTFTTTITHLFLPVSDNLNNWLDNAVLSREGALIFSDALTLQDSGFTIEAAYKLEIGNQYLASWTDSIVASTVNTNLNQIVSDSLNNWLESAEYQLAMRTAFADDTYNLADAVALQLLNLSEDITQAISDVINNWNDQIFISRSADTVQLSDDMNLMLDLITIPSTGARGGDFFFAAA